MAPERGGFHVLDHPSSILSPSPLLWWLIASVLAYTAGTTLAWYVRRRGAWRAPYDQWLEEGVRFVFYLVVPYLALGGWPRQPYQGLLAPGDMGLVGPGPAWPASRWLESAGTGLALALGTLIVVLVAQTQATRAAGEDALGFPPRPWWRLLVDGLYLEVHWAFYRGALAVMLGDLYAGVFGGLGLAFVEWGLNPSWREGWRQPSSAASLWLRAVLALLSALLFLLTRNLWVCLAIHLLLTVILWRSQPRPLGDTAGDAGA
jgi:hypothetical protein